MNISRLNPIGYEAKTEKGNTYKKSNAAKTGLLAGAVLINAATYAFPKNRISKMFTTGALVKEIAKMCKKTGPVKFNTLLEVLGVAGDLVFWYISGAMWDKSINKQRAAKADELAQNPNAAAQAVDKK